jgi:hypothetical protein
VISVPEATEEAALPPDVMASVVVVVAAVPQAGGRRVQNEIPNSDGRTTRKSEVGFMALTPAWHRKKRRNPSFKWTTWSLCFFWLQINR